MKGLVDVLYRHVKTCSSIPAVTKRLVQAARLKTQLQMYRPPQNDRCYFAAAPQEVDFGDTITGKNVTLAMDGWSTVRNDPMLEFGLVCKN